MLSLSKIHRLPRDIRKPYDLTNEHGEVRETKLLTQSEANRLNNCILFTDRHPLGRDMQGLWVTAGQFDKVLFEYELSKQIKEEKCAL